jgi:hypothetical protein
VKAISEASLEDLNKVVNLKVAQSVCGHFKSK